MGAEKVVDAEVGLVIVVVVKDCTLLGLWVSELLVSGRMGTLNPDVGDELVVGAGELLNVCKEVCVDGRGNGCPTMAEPDIDAEITEGAGDMLG